MLADIFEMQRVLNESILGFDIFSIGGDEERKKWFRNYLTAYDQELKELLESLNLGSIISGERTVDGRGIDFNNIRVEIVDMLHFLISMFQVIGERQINGEYLGFFGDEHHYFRKIERKMVAKLETIFQSREIVNKMLIYNACRNCISAGRLLDCISWKWWARQETDWQRVRKLLYEEMFPVWCELAVASGMDYETVRNLYVKKNRLNFERQMKGYRTGNYRKIDESGREDNEKLFK